MSALDKKPSQMPNQAIPGESDLFVYGNDVVATWAQLKAAIASASSSLSLETCLANATTNINLGSASLYKGFTIDIEYKRGTRYRKEILQVINDLSDAYVFSSGFITIPNTEEETLGLEISADIDSGQARLNIIVDNSSVTNVNVAYRLTNFSI